MHFKNKRRLTFPWLLIALLMLAALLMLGALVGIGVQGYYQRHPKKDVPCADLHRQIRQAKAEVARIDGLYSKDVISAERLKSFLPKEIFQGDTITCPHGITVCIGRVGVEPFDYSLTPINHQDGNPLSCSEILRTIQDAKEKAAERFHLCWNSQPSLDDLAACGCYLETERDGKVLCSQGGTITIGVIGENPACCIATSTDSQLTEENKRTHRIKIN